MQFTSAGARASDNDNDSTSDSTSDSDSDKAACAPLGRRRLPSEDPGVTPTRTSGHVR